MRPVRLFAIAIAAASLALAAGGVAIAWGSSGHRMIGQAAVEALPDEVPAFLRGRKAAAAIGELAREPDRWKGSGRTHDHDRDAAHYLNLGDSGEIIPAMRLADMPTTRAEYEKALQAAGADSWKLGYLQYSIVDSYQQLVKDFGYWRVLLAAEKRARGERKAWYRADRIRREQLIFRDAGVLAHYVGDGSQPLHVTIHYNGWGDHPNPKGYTTDRIHGPFEGAFVNANIGIAGVRGALPDFQDCRCPIDRRVVAYLQKTQSYVDPLYGLWAQGGFQGADPRGVAFATERLGAGAGELRDLIIMAWRDSASIKVGWPAVSVADVEAGRVDPWIAMIGED